MSLHNILTSPALAGMRALRQWVVYFLTADPKQPGKKTKIPMHHLTGTPCSVVDPANWTDAQTAAQAASSWGADFGVGFCFTSNDPFWFIDLDSCRQADGTWSPLALTIAQALPGAAMEVSASGNGLHLFGRGVVPPHASKNIEAHAECYTEGRFCAMTGFGLQGSCDLDFSAGMSWVVQSYFPPKNGGGHEVLAEGPSPDWNGPADDADLLRRALNSRGMGSVFGTKASFADLWLADPGVLAKAFPADANSPEPYDRSSADAALAQHLAFWTGRDQARSERLMRQSKLARDKYDRPDYLPRTIGNACSMQRDVLKDKPVEGPNAPGAPTPAPSAPPPLPGPVPAAAGPSAPAPTASQIRRVEGTTFLSPEQQIEMFKGCVYVQNEHRVLVPGAADLLSPEKFRARFGGYTWVMDNANEKVSRNAWEAFTESQAIRAPRVDKTCFKPKLPFGAIIEHAGQSAVNTYVPPNIRRKPGDASPFLRHLEKLMPDETERAVVFYYLCCCVQHIGFKAQWALVLQGAEGNGKSFISQCVAEAVGKQYVFWPRANRVTSNFNSWLVGKVLYVIEEIMVHGRQEMMDELKVLITSSDGIEIEKKGVDQSSGEIVGNFLCNTNHKNAILKTRNDRRWCVIQTAQQTAADLARDQMLGDYMHRLWTWGREQDGFAIVSELLHTTRIPAEYDFTRGLQRAPRTRSTDLVIADSRGPVEQEIVEAIERDEIGFRGGWISSGFLDALLRKIGKDKALALNNRRAALQSLGYDWHPALADGRVNNPTVLDGAKVKLFVRLDRPDLLALRTPAEVASAYASAQGVGGK